MNSLFRSLPAIVVGVGMLSATVRAQDTRRADSPRSAQSQTKDFAVSPLETQVLGQRSWLRGGPASLRVIVTDHMSGKPIHADVALSLIRLENSKPSGNTLPLYTGSTSSMGTIDAKFKAPVVAPGAYQLSIDVKSNLGEDKIVEPIQLQESIQLLLTADKPLYQPGQTMHIRALAQDTATYHALADQPVTFEVEDARGNKVCKQHVALSKFGIASADFVLADEVNMGVFTLRAILPQGQTEKKVRVERYVLPKYKIALTTEKPFYLPGEQVKGTVKATYFFGKPVADSQVTIAIDTIDIGVNHLTEIKDHTDAVGTYTFRYTLPRSFVGQPFEQGKAVIDVHATVKDRADHQQEAHLNIPVVKEPITLAVVPESRTLTPSVENRVYIAAATPDGSPLKSATLEVTASWSGIKQPLIAHLKSDELGLAVFDFTPDVKSAPAKPSPISPVTLVVKATDTDGRQATVTQQLASSPLQEGIILRPDKTLAKVGERVNLLTLSSMKGGTLYLDVIRNKQTILTRAEPMHEGRTQFSLSITPDMVGTLQIHVYKILPNENIIRDTRTLIVSPANDLTVSVTADKMDYKPGGDANLRFTVMDQHKHPVQAALGLAVVDESVFALSELQPGLERIYFTLEKELMEPKYEIHGLTPTGLMRPGPVQWNGPVRQRAAALLLAAVPAEGDFDLRVDTFQTRWANVRARAVQVMMERHRKIVNAIQKYRADAKSSLSATDSLTALVPKGYLQESDLLDPWGHFYRAELNGVTNYDGYFTLSSAGPDGKWGTNDDILNVSMYGMYRNRGFGGGVVRRMAAGGRAFANRDMADAVPEDASLLAKAAVPAAAPKMALTNTASDAKKSGASGGSSGSAAPRVRQYFPETMYWNPALLTDEEGHAQLSLPLADSITTWRLSMLANSTSGQLGSSTAPIKVFQDFFVDIDLPISLTQHDRVEVPVAVYNYLPTPQDVTLTLKQESWFTLQGKATQTIKVPADQVSVVYFPIVAAELGNHALEVTARGSKLSDAMRRSIAVTPDGKMLENTLNDRLEAGIEKTLSFPADALPGASSLWVKLYPGTFSQVVEGVDGILQMPNGCFEQTSSTTYPDVLVLDYLRQTKRINPELQMKAESYINIGYQRLVTFECKSGGFSWFGNEPAHQVLTAYGLLEFSDMAKVHDVDPNLIARTQQWLAGKQQPDGTWEEKGQGIAEGIINRQTGALRTTAYIAWALAESGYQGPQLATGVAYVKAHLNEARDPYTLAVILNLLTKVDRDGDSTARAAQALIDLAKTSDKAANWQSDSPTFTGARERGADLETCGLAAYGLSKWGRNSGFTTKALTYLVQSKDSYGTWSSTQGTVWCMKALLYASRNGVGNSKGTVTVLVNGKKAAEFKITPEDSDVMRQVNLSDHMDANRNTITLHYQGEGAPLYQIVARSYVPWSAAGAPVVPAMQPLKLTVDYDKKTLAQDDTATVSVTIHNNTEQVADMPLIDVGVPPGFTVNPEKLDDAVKANTISKYTVAARQIILYLEKLDPGQTVTLTYQIKAKYPLKARTPLSKAYPYYNPEKVAISNPQDIVVHQ